VTIKKKNVPSRSAIYHLDTLPCKKKPILPTGAAVANVAEAAGAPGDQLVEEIEIEEAETGDNDGSGEPSTSEDDADFDELIGLLDSIY